MLTLITGGSGSGKSEYAEQTAVRCANSQKPLIYIATMIPRDREAEDKIKRHRLNRSGKHFTTLECPYGLFSMEIPQGSVVLLECLSNLLANEMYEPEGAKRDPVSAILKGIQHVEQSCSHLIVVTVEVFSSSGYDSSIVPYIHNLGKLNTCLASEAEHVIEVVYSIPVSIKGELCHVFKI